jgi:hypothetical protein
MSTDKSIKEHRDKTVVCLPDLDDQVAATPAAQELFAEMKKKNMGTLADLLEGKIGKKDRINIDELFRLGQAIGMTQMKRGKPAISAKNIWVSLSDLTSPRPNERVAPPVDRRRKLSAVLVKDIRSAHVDGESIRSLARSYELSPATVWKIVHGYYWKNTT